MKKRVALRIILAMVVSIYAWKATGKIRFSSALSELCDVTNDVVLERYYSGSVLQSATISKETFKTWLDQLPRGLGRLPKTYTKCWVPHHRINFSGNTENKIEICFTCNEIWTEATGRRKIPEDWRQPLRALFLASDISVAAPYSKEDIDAIIEEAEQASAGQPATASESKSEGGDKPKPVSEPAPR